MVQDKLGSGLDHQNSKASARHVFPNMGLSRSYHVLDSLPLVPSNQTSKSSCKREKGSNSQSQNKAGNQQQARFKATWPFLSLTLEWRGKENSNTACRCNRVLMQGDMVNSLHHARNIQITAMLSIADENGHTRVDFFLCEMFCCTCTCT